MINVSTVSTSFIILGLVEMERLKYFYFTISLALYLIIMLLTSMIVSIIVTEPRLHEPMYLFICNLFINGIFGSTTLFPKLIINLLSGSKIVSLVDCLIQAFCVHTFGAVELLTFTVMAQDRYLAVGQPLRYPTLMTNGKALTFIAMIWVTTFIGVLVPVMMTAWLPLCGININNLFCDNMSLVKLACGDSSVNNIFGAVEAFLMNFIALVIIIYCYIKTFLICLKVSKEAYQKAVSTLVTHLYAFSSFLIAAFFVLLRYRINSATFPLYGHITLSVIGLVTPTIVNPLIYGLRTEALRSKIIQNFRKLHDLRKPNV
ncbi:olfactory receptor 4C12-like [Spea bombifrons]|uniref:olfactory receptor 4C12-like n=1 Tax=Spea bombifrons TaxID=233779 RepID=UPI002349E4E3|nr:olfactory receptor 4C12-like [Spea bombifrons]